MREKEWIYQLEVVGSINQCSEIVDWLRKRWWCHYQNWNEMSIESKYVIKYKIWTTNW